MHQAFLVAKQFHINSAELKKWAISIGEIDKFKTFQDNFNIL